MKVFSILMLGLTAMTASLVAAEPVKHECHCVNCACTPESNCGCYAEQGCHCGPNCDGTNCRHSVETTQPAVAPKGK